VGEWIRDFKWAGRSLLRQPVFTATAVFTLILAIGATTAVFSVLYAVLWSPLPFAEPDRLIRISSTNPSEGVERAGISSADFLDFRESLSSFESLHAFRYFGLSISGVERPAEITTLLITPGLLKTLGVSPIYGRTFLEEEGEPGQNQVILLTHSLWQTRFGGDPALVGQQLLLDGNQFTVVGIAPPGFSYPDEEVQMFSPLVVDPEQARRDRRWMTTIARLKPGVSVEQSRAEVTALAKGLESQFPKTNEGWGAEVRPLLDVVVGDSAPALKAIFGAVLLMLLIACANVANLLLARSVERRREVAVRAALGAGRRRLVRLLLSESVLLAIIGGLGGALLAALGIRLLAIAGPENLPRLTEVRMDGLVFLFAFLASLVTGLVFGALPALQLSRTDLHLVLKDGGDREGSGRAGGRARGLLTVAELALALLLLVGAGLFLKGFLALTSVEPGFEPDHVLATQIFVYGAKYREDEPRRVFFEQLFDEIRGIPGVEAVSAVSSIPLSGIGNGSARVQIVGRAELEPERVGTRSASSGYFEAMGIPLRKGRAFSNQDAAGAPLVAVINETASRRFFGAQDPLTQRFRVDGSEDEATIVGVVGDLRHGGLGEEVAPEIFFPFAQANTGTMTVVTRTATDPRALASLVESKVWRVDPDQPVFRTLVMEDRLNDSVAQPRFYATLIGIFAIVALILACVGLYGVISYAVSQRTREIGIRMALGAQNRDVFGLIIKNGLTLVLIGLGAGLFGAFALTRLVRNLLYGVSPTDPATFLWVPVILAAVSLAACYLPARRATAVNPLVALRGD